MKSHLAFKKRNLSLGVNLQILKDHDKISNRFTKTLYYGKSPNIDRPSLSLTDLSVKVFGKAVSSSHLDFIDMDYASQVGRDACISPCSMMLAMVYIERLRTKNPEYIQTVSSSDLFLVSMMIASKFLNDEGEDDEVFNGEWAASSGLELKELNKLEREFLAAIEWEVFVSPTDFMQVMNDVETRVAMVEGKKRGWLTYTDLDVLVANLEFVKHWNLIKENLIDVIVICSVAYAAAICVLIGSTALVSSGINVPRLFDNMNLPSDRLQPDVCLDNCNVTDNQNQTVFEHGLPVDYYSSLLSETLPNVNLREQNQTDSVIKVKLDLYKHSVKHNRSTIPTWKNRLLLVKGVGA